MLESSARIESLANAWDQINSEPPLAAPPASLPNFTMKAGFFGQAKALVKRFAGYKQPGSLLTWISKLISAAVLSLCIGCIFWDVPASDAQLSYNDRFGYHHCVMVLAYWPLVMLTIRDTQEDRRHAERDIRLGLYSRSLYIVVQVSVHPPTRCDLYLMPSLSLRRASLASFPACASGWLICCQRTAWRASTPTRTAATLASICIWVSGGSCCQFCRE